MSKDIAQFDYRADQHILREFFANFRADEALGGDPKYMSLIKQVATAPPHLRTIGVDLEDLRVFLETYQPADPGRRAHVLGLPARILHNFTRYRELIERVIDALMPEPSRRMFDAADPRDTLAMHRLARLSKRGRAPNPAPDANTGATDQIPEALLRLHTVSIAPPADLAPIPLRGLNAQQIGRFAAVRGIVAGVSEARPRADVLSYVCTRCGAEVYREVLGEEFAPPKECPVPGCADAGGRDKGLLLHVKGSRFVRLQDVRIQELAEEVPTGHVPRTLTVRFEGPLAQTVFPGDVVTVFGTPLPVAATGLAKLRGGPIAGVRFYASALEKQEVGEANDEAAASSGEFAWLLTRPDMEQVLINSIAPELFGLEEVKRAILHLMAGGVAQKLSGGLHVRGDINACLVGDPGLAKSQLLKFVSATMTRGVYTTGKGSSSVGLTAALVRDPVTRDFSLEGGALVLADRGVCCIDEFDKMSEEDRTAIHEAMEQGTVSIAKGGITTTLNARASVLAAANPLWGRYNPSYTPAQNIAMPPALLSRFDVLFVLRDTVDAGADRALAEHVTKVHATADAEPVEPDRDAEPDRAAERTALTQPELRRFIALCKQFSPSFPPDLSSRIVRRYVDMRAADREAEARGEPLMSAHTSARTLQSLLRLAQAAAKLRLSATVSERDIAVAEEIIESARASVEEASGYAGPRDAELSVRRVSERDFRGSQRKRIEVVRPAPRARAKGRRTDRRTLVWRRVRSLLVASERRSVPRADAESAVIAADFTSAEFAACLDEYELLGVVSVSQDGQSVRLLQ